MQITYEGDWEISILEDDDGHLNIYVQNLKSNTVINTDTGQGDGTSGEQYAIRFTTPEIEESLDI